jgi:hypothetical protein
MHVMSCLVALAYATMLILPAGQETCDHLPSEHTHTLDGELTNATCPLRDDVHAGRLEGVLAKRETVYTGPSGRSAELDPLDAQSASAAAKRMPPQTPSMDRYARRAFPRESLALPVFHLLNIDVSLRTRCALSVRFVCRPLK